MWQIGKGYAPVVMPSCRTMAYWFRHCERNEVKRGSSTCRLRSKNLAMGESQLRSSEW